MPETERTYQNWLSSLLTKRPQLLKIARPVYALLNKMLIHTIGMRLVSTDSLAINKNGLDRLFYFEKLITSLKDVAGDIVECGVSSGSSLSVLCILTGHSGIRRHVWGFDTFEGLPTPISEDLSNPKSLAEKGLYSASRKMVISTLRVRGVDENIINNQITLVKGPFSQTLPKYSGSSIAFLHIDADLYESYKIALEELWPKVTAGGIVAFDEYEKPDTWPGARRAIDEYFSHRAASVRIDRDSAINKYYAIKLH